MADYPDVLDALGKTPREFGSVHVHLEPVVVDDRWGWTTVWFQGAFEPGDTKASFELVTCDEPRRVLLASQRVPDLSGGRVVKGIVRFKLGDEVAQVALAVKSEVAPGAERCRQAWKLFDTIEIPKESEMRGSGGGGPGINVGATVAASLLAAPLGFAVISFNTGGGGAGPSLSEQTRSKVHKAQELPDYVLAEVQRAEARPPPGDGFEVFWTPGQPVPEAPPLVLPERGSAQPAPVSTAPKAGRRECSSCGFSGKREDFGGDRFCPQCGNEWD